MPEELPVLLPPSALPKQHRTEWQPTTHLLPPQQPPVDERTLQDQVIAAAKQMMDGKTLKKTRPRRTVDYGGGMGRWILNRKIRPNPRYIPQIRPAPPHIIDLLPPKAYTNPSTSLCTKFVHTSTNKIRCPVNCVLWTPEGRRVLTGSTSGEFTLWNGLTFNFETILQAHDSAVRAMTFNHSGSYLASADQNGIIKYFQPNMNNLVAWSGHHEAIRALTFSPDDGKFATASDDSTLKIWSFEERREERVLTGHGWDVRCVQWHPTKGLLVSGSKDNLIKFWDPRTGTCLSTLHQHKNTIQDLAWSPNGDLLASASRDQTVRVFDIRAMKELRVLKGHKKEVCSLAWHPVHPILVSGGSEGALLHWDVNTPDNLPGSNLPAGPRATLSQAHDSNVWSLAFHPLGHILVSGSNDHTTRFWSRERPGDASSVFSGGGAKPPEMGGQDQDDEDDVPGFGPAGPGGSGGWWGGKDEFGQSGDWGDQHGSGSNEDLIPGIPGLAPQPPTGPNASGSGNGDQGIPGIPGLNMAPPVAPRQSGSLPSQDDSYGNGGEDWSSRSYGRQGRWGPRRGGPRY